MEIAGGGSEHILPRSQPFPFPPHTPSRSDVTLQASHPLWVPVPTARSNGGSRPMCCSNGICDRCPIDSKFTILNGIGHFEHDGCFLLSEHEVREVTVEAGVAKSVAVQGSTQSFEINANLIALGTNAIFNAAILMRSGFTSPVLGRYLHEQVGYTIQVDTPIKNFFGGSAITGHGYHFYHDFDRTNAAAVLLENFNVPASIRPTKNRWTERLTLKLVAEDVPNSENRVELKDGEVMINWPGHSAYARQGIDNVLGNLDQLIPAEIEDVIHLGEASTEAHILGTTRMGQSVQTSVVDDTLRTHEVSNVVCLGAGAFPSSSPANPTLTLSALSVRAARSL